MPGRYAGGLTRGNAPCQYNLSVDWPEFNPRSPRPQYLKDADLFFESQTVAIHIRVLHSRIDYLESYIRELTGISHDR